MTYPNDSDQNSQQFPNRPQFNGIPEQPRRYYPPQPPRFWQIVLKDMATVIVGIGFFCLCGFVLMISSLTVIGKTLMESVPSSTSLVQTTLRGSENCANKVAVLPIEGVIATDETGFLTEAIEEIKNDSRVRALVLRVNSPGGTISGSDYYLHLLKRLKAELEIPVVVSMGDIAASGGYYISTVADKIFAERSTMTGSIGVIMSMYNGAELCEKIGVKSNAITSGPMKNMGDFTKEPTPEETAIWQKCVNDSYEQFLSVIKEGRPWFRGEDGAPVIPKPQHKQVAGVKVKTIAAEEETPVEKAVEETPADTPAEEAPAEDAVAEAAASEETPAEAETAEEAASPSVQAAEEAPAPDVAAERDAALRKLADGRIYSAQDALDLHLVDEIGFLDDAIDAAIEAAGLVESDTEVVRYEEEEAFLDTLLQSYNKTEPLNKALDAVSTPRAYYICPRALP